MRTNIVLDDELVEEAFRHSDAGTGAAIWTTPDSGEPLRASMRSGAVT